MQISLANLNIEFPDQYKLYVGANVHQYQKFAVSSTRNDIVIRQGDVLKDVSDKKVIFKRDHYWHILEDQDQYYYAYLNKNRVLSPVLSVSKDFKNAFLCAAHVPSNEYSNFIHSSDILLILEHLNYYRRGMLMHACGLAYEGDGYLFLGESGAGKTTLARAFGQAIGEPHVLNDEKVIVSFDAGMPVAWGTPWCGDGQMAVNRSAPLRAMFFLRQSMGNSMIGLSLKDAYKELLKVTFLASWHKKGFEHHLDMLDHLVQVTPAYVLMLEKGSGAVQFILNRLSKRC